MLPNVTLSAAAEDDRRHSVPEIATPTKWIAGPTSEGDVRGDVDPDHGDPWADRRKSRTIEAHDGALDRPPRCGVGGRLLPREHRQLGRRLLPRSGGGPRTMDRRHIGPWG